jgi:hypothetical protein
VDEVTQRELDASWRRTMTRFALSGRSVRQERAAAGRFETLINRQLIAAMRAANVGESTIRQGLMVLQAAMACAFAEDRVSENPVRKPHQEICREVPPLRRRRSSVCVPCLALTTP